MCPSPFPLALVPLQLLLLALRPDRVSGSVQITQHDGRGGAVAAPTTSIESKISAAEEALIRTSGLASCEREALWEKALDILSSMQKQKLGLSNRAWNHVIGALHRSGQWQKILEVKDRMLDAGVHANYHVYIQAIKVMSAVPPRTIKNLSEKVYALLEEMSSKNLEPDIATYSTVVQVMRHHKEDREVDKIMSKLFYLFKSNIEGIEAYYSYGRHGRALEIISQMTERRVKPTVEMMNVAVISCARNHAWSRILDIIKAIKSRGVRGNILTYNAALSAMRRGVRWQTASALLRQMRNDRIAPDVQTYNIVNAIAREAAPGEVAKDIDMILRIPEVSEIMAKSIGAFALQVNRHVPTKRFPRWWKALRLMQRLQKNGFALTGEMFEKMSRECVQEGNWSMFLKVLATMDSRDFPISEELYNVGLRLMRQAKQWEVAIDMFREMHSRQMGFGFPTESIITMMLSELELFDVMDDLIQQKILKKLAIELPNGRYNIYAPQVIEGTKLSMQPKAMGDGSLQIGAYQFKIVGMNIPADPMDRWDRMSPGWLFLNQSFQHGFNIPGPLQRTKSLGRVNDERDLIRNMFLNQYEKVVSELPKEFQQEHIGLTNRRKQRASGVAVPMELDAREGGI